MKKKLMSITAAVLSTVICLTGCGTGKKTANVEFDVTTDGSYPIQTDAKLSYWVQLHEAVAAKYNNLGEAPFGQELVKETGIGIDFIHPPTTQVSEKFNLMIASEDLPDIIEWNWYSLYPGGPHAAIEDGVILPLNDIIEKAAPNLAKYLEEHPDVKKLITTDEGEIYCFPMLRGSDYLNTFQGPMFRKDLLDKAGLDVPETLDEWETALYKFKEMGVKVPLMMKLGESEINNSFILGAYNVAGTFYLDNGKVKYGPYEEKEFTDFVTRMTKWYKDGLLDPDFTDEDVKRYNALGVSGDWGVAFGSCGGGFGSWIPAIKSTNPSAEFVPAKYPVTTKGENAKFGQKSFAFDGFGAAISTNCKNIEMAARLLDYGYSEKGINLYNYGIEGESYTMENGVPTYTKIITDGEQPMGQMIAQYARASYFGPMIQQEGYMRQYAKLDEQKAGLETWLKNENTEHILPLVTLTADENSEYSSIMADINTYRQETLYKTITGVTSVDNLPEYFQTLKNMGIEKAIEINQAAYERYLKR